MLSSKLSSPSKKSHRRVKRFHFHLLPFELLSKIFEYSVPYSEDGGPSKASLLAALSLASVNKQWRLTAVLTRTLWNRTNLSANVHPGLMEIFLQRAGDQAPQRSFGTHPTNRWFLQHLHFIVTNPHKWRSLDLDLNFDYSAARARCFTLGLLDPLRPISWPSLDHAAIDNLWHFKCDIVPQQPHVHEKTRWALQFVRAATQLRTLQLSIPDLGPVQQTRWASTLTRINIQTSALGSGLTLTDIYSILFSTPLIAECSFTLKDNNTAMGNLTAFPNLPRLVLNHLRSIDLDGNWNLRVTLALYQLIEHAPRLIYLNANPTSLDQSPNTFVQILNSAPANIVHLMIDDSWIDETLLLAFFSHPKLKNSLMHLYVNGSENSEETIPIITDTFFDALTPTTINQSLFMPTLEEIDLIWCFKASNGRIYNMVEGRRRKGQRKLSLNFRTTERNTPSVRYPTDWVQLGNMALAYPFFLKRFWWEISKPGGRIQKVNYPC